MSDQDRAEREARSEGRSRWLMVHEGDGSTGRVKLERAHRPRFLYRGQNRHHDPCWPSLCRRFRENTYLVRDLDPLDRARLLRALALNNWFTDEVAKHPMMKWAAKERIAVDTTAIAQHYGVPTGYMDASESFEVSAFFATCRYIHATDQWEPMREGEGVMYRLHREAVDERASPIAYQPFPRPSRQWAWTVELRLGEDFLQAPMLQAFRFEHDPKVGEEVLKRFGGGPDLLPPDPTARLAAAMCIADEIPVSYVEEAESDMASDPSGVPVDEARGLRQILKDQLKCALSNRSSVTYSTADLVSAESEWQTVSSEFYRGVGFSLVRTERGDKV